MKKTVKLQPMFVQHTGCNRRLTSIRPKLTLSGKWLEEAGFLPSALIDVEVQFGKMIITSKEVLS